MVRNRPVNLNLLSLRFPLPAWISIAHRISGLFLICLIPFLLWALQESLASQAAFEKLKLTLRHPLIRISCWIMISALGYHLIAGLRHLLMDIHIGTSLQAGRLSAKLTLLLSVLLALIWGYCLW